MFRKRKTVGMALIIVSLAAMFFWEVLGRDMVNSEEILALKENADKYQIITEEMIKVIKVKKASDEALRPSQRNEIIGTASSQFVHKDAPLFIEYFENIKLLAGGEEKGYVMAIPNQWLLSYPQTLRRGDVAYFYLDGIKITSAIVAYAKDGSNKEVISEGTGRLEGSSNISLVEVLLDEEEANKLSVLAAEGNKFVIMYN